MKNQFLKLVFVVICLGIMLTGCEKDTTEVYVVSELPFSSRVVSLDEIPEIADYMNKNIYCYSFRSILNDGEPVYDNKKIIETIDKEGKTNYIISFIYDETINNEFYNLIINVFPNGERKSYVAKYICDTSAYDKFASNNFNFYYFKGVVEFTSIKATTNRGGPCPPLTTIIDANNEAGTNPNNNSQFTNSSNSQIMNQTLGYNSNSLTIYFTGGSGNGGHVFDQGNSDGAPCNCYQPLRREININPNFNEPCPDPVPQGFITPNISQAAINNLKIALGLTNPQWRWFTMAGNDVKFEPFYLAYMSDPTRNTPETKAFFVATLIQMMLNQGLSQTQITTTNFPGIEIGMTYNWWNNQNYITTNMQMFNGNNLNSNLTPPNTRELLLFSLFPKQALIHYKNSNFALNQSIALATTNTLSFAHNGKADAFRHSLWNAIDTAQIGTAITKLFTDAHEWNSNNHPLETQMDNFNNNVGRTVGDDFNFFSSQSEISNLIITYLFYGQLKYLSPLDLNGNILPNTLLKNTDE